MKFINTIEELIAALNNTSLSEYPKVIKKVRFAEDSLLPFSTWNKCGYTRNCLARTDCYELVLLCWDVNAQTPIHGHGGKDCWVYQVQGSIEEMRFEEQEDCLIEQNRMVLHHRRLTYMHDRMGYHSLRNISDQKAMTLHIYASPIDSCKVYNDDKNCFEMKEMSYHTYWEEKLASTV